FVSYPMVQLLEAATLPRHPSGPKRKLAIAGGVLASLMILGALCLAWVRQPIIGLLLKRLQSR
ncbi:MAG: hypothetical protein AAFX85_13650, partial [Pseudomonadota bacterium]